LHSSKLEACDLTLALEMQKRTKDGNETITCAFKIGFLEKDHKNWSRLM